ncbi:MAG TPA: pantoate--beta-alanine ligase [Bryobacteraceae bacterium]|jgi:pantoate--beta-alanine ligase|nr:pantoate--beta-alanine ligase [Bryobacteraceae bacterium]
MRVWRSLPEWQAHRRAIGGATVGFVPTMGALHRGHATLIERCRQDNEVAVVSIFVNPTQFDDARDLALYPRTLEKDLGLLQSLDVDDVLSPEPEAMYPAGRRFRIEETGISEILEGAYRPGFFQGVMTVVLKLLNLVRADRAYFGEKDFQQLQIVTEMAREFFVGTEIVACPTVREESGLAESSRNARLSPEARSTAAVIHRALSSAPDPNAARRIIQDAGFSVDYVEERWGRRLAAARIEGVRLIDNVAVK